MAWHYAWHHVMNILMVIIILAVCAHYLHIISPRKKLALVACRGVCYNIIMYGSRIKSLG